VQELTVVSSARALNTSPESSVPKVRALIVDDEPLARRALGRCLGQFPSIEVIGESGSGVDALKAVHQHHPDLMFLDVEMPGMSGLDVVTKLQGSDMPVIVFVTGHDQYALDAFRAHALDFILKPLDESRVGDVMERVVKQIRLHRLDGLEQRLQSALQQMEQRGNGDGSSGQDGVHKLAVKENGRIRLLDVASINWIEASGNYVTMHVGPSKHLIRETMNTMESRLDPSTFLRIHRSTIVNLRSVVEFRPGVNGSFLVVLGDQTHLISSRGYHRNIERFLASLR
jgi:two-component system LytT family response regulator